MKEKSIMPKGKKSVIKKAAAKKCVFDEIKRIEQGCECHHLGELYKKGILELKKTIENEKKQLTQLEKLKKQLKNKEKIMLAKQKKTPTKSIKTEIVKIKKETDKLLKEQNELKVSFNNSKEQLIHLLQSQKKYNAIVKLFIQFEKNWGKKLARNKKTIHKKKT